MQRIEQVSEFEEIALGGRAGPAASSIRHIEYYIPNMAKPEIFLKIRRPLLLSWSPFRQAADGTLASGRPRPKKLFIIENRASMSAKLSKSWLEGELRLSGIDRRMMALLRAIADTGSISQAARACGLSYKGAWQMIERANNSAPRLLISTSTGGSKGGGACLTASGRALLNLYAELEGRHRNFLRTLNQSLAADPGMRLLLQHLAVKTSAANQLFGAVTAVRPGPANAAVDVDLAGDLAVRVTVSLDKLKHLKIIAGLDAVLLINGADMVIAADSRDLRFLACNRLVCTIIRVDMDEVNAEVKVSLANGDILSCLITRESAEQLNLGRDTRAWIMFKSDAPILGIKATPEE